MHLLREGQFGVASTFIGESKARPPNPSSTANNAQPYTAEQWEKAFTSGQMDSGALQQQFAEMYHILHELKQQQNLQPAIAWSRNHSAQLEARGSNLEFELCRLQYVCLFMGHALDGSISDPDQGPLRAWAYARSEFGAFQSRYSREIQQLIGAMAFWENMGESPYKRTFYNEHAFEEVAGSFTREFCSLLGLSADSPLYIAATAGAIALPTLLKLQSIMREKKTEWTSQNELPVSQLRISHGYTERRLVLTGAGGNPPATLVLLPLHLRLPSLQRTNNRPEPSDDDAVRSRHRQGVVGQDQQRCKVQVPVLPGREPSERCEEGVLVGCVTGR